MPPLPSARRSSPPGASKPHAACTCGSLRMASRRISQFYDTALAPVGIKSTQYSILTAVARGTQQGTVTMAELALAMAMDRSTLGHNLKPLQRDRLVLLRSSDRDRRKRYVELTSQGRATLRRARRRWATAENHFEKVFGRSNAAKLRTDLLSIAGNARLNGFNGA